MIASLVAATAAAVIAAAPASPPTVQVQHWVNPSGSVQVRTASCGAKLCGWITWASAEAIADAREGGVPQVVRLQLLQGYEPVGPGRWRGRVFVPDWNRTFSSTITQVAPDRLKISGCVVGGFICKSQIWTIAR